jgi:sterol desaturase/sphingolipid hydroxylase (fatty acid hydroxylase superfamily)
LQNIGTAPPLVRLAQEILGPAPDLPTGQNSAAADAARQMRQRLLLGFACYYLFAVFFCWLISRDLDDRIIMTILGQDFVVDRLRVRIVNVAILATIIMPAVFAVELIAVGWQRSSLCSLLGGRSATGRTDVACFVLWQVHLLHIPRVALTFGVSLVAGTWLHVWLRERTGLSLSLAGLPFLAQYLGYFLVYTFWDYWQHRLDHSRFFWPIHRYHHGAEEFHILTSLRVHPASFSQIIVMTLPLAVVDASPGLIAGLAFGTTILRLIIHSRIDSDFGWIGRWLLQSPVGHRLHHRLDPAAPASNLSLFPVWDRLFGTWEEGGNQAIVIGVSKPYRQGAWILPDMWRDYREFLLQLVALLRWRKAPAGEP